MGTELRATRMSVLSTDRVHAQLHVYELATVNFAGADITLLERDYMLCLLNTLKNWLRSGLVKPQTSELNVQHKN
jgi:hypothetical protein